ncbi:MAG: ferrous iron transport protein A [Planctomycetaceae bacterium]|nr:ferrous iron transport protein A [Planctomycetaceae bacterium]
MFPVETLRSGEAGRVVGVDGQLDIVQRLQDVGLRIGATVRMLREGTPVLLAVDDQRLTFRPDQRAMVLVEPTA